MSSLPDGDVKCAVCDNNIEGRILSALGKTYHPEHFTCAKCELPIKDEKFQQYEGLPYCDDDYTKLFAKKCHACKHPIKNKLIKALGVEWHEEHFICNSCKKSLASSTFMEKDGFPYCQNCYQEKFADKCKGCGKAITEKAIIALNEKWHQECFKCLKCNEPVVEDSFQVQNGLPICGKCS